MTVSSHPLLPPFPERRPRAFELHGERLDDDFFWLRDREDPAVLAYLGAENAYAEQLLAPTRDLREQLYREMVGRIKETDSTVPYRHRGWFYYRRTEEGKQYPILCRKRGTVEAPEEILLDLNVLAEGQPFMALGAFEVSDNGRLLAYSTDPTGSREYSLVVRDLTTGAQVGGPIPRAGSVAWAADDRAFFYTVEDDAKRAYRVYRHTLGGGGGHDLVFEEPDARFRVAVERTRSRRYVLLEIASHTTTEVHCLPAAAPQSSWRVLAPRVPEREYEAEHLGDEGWLIRVNDTGPQFRVVAAPEHDARPEAWTEVLAHRDDVMLEGLETFAEFWVAWERTDGLSGIRVTDRGSGVARTVELPDVVGEAFPDANAEWETARFRYAYESPVMPTSTYDYDVAAGASVLLKRREVPGGFDPARYGTERGRAAAPDGTRIPYSLVFRREPPLPRPAPMLLTGYGAYGIPFPLGFSSNRLTLLDRGVEVAIAHVRGGGELGKRWHDAGRMGRKMNTFTDFIAVAERLVADGRTAPGRLAIEGGSAGGLMVTAATNLRPELFRAVVAQVPFVDVINTMLDASLPLTVGEYEEWGNPADPEHYRWIRPYCPYTNLAARDYPAMLVRTSLHDSQVMYWEPAKYVAKLRTLKRDDRPLLLVTNLGAGHGGASGRYDRLREVALDYAFTLWQLGVRDDGR